MYVDCWLIDCLAFYAVSAIFQPCNGGFENVKCIEYYNAKCWNDESVYIKKSWYFTVTTASSFTIWRIIKAILKT